MADGYPFGDLPKAFEQLGWLKAQMDAFATKEDMANLRGEIKDLIRNELDMRDKARRIDDEKRDRAMLEKLEKAFEHAMPGTQKLVDEQIKKRDAEKDTEFKAKLKKKGMKLDETGEVVHIVHPVKTMIKRNLTYVSLVVIVATMVNPAMTYSAARMLWEFFS